MQYVIEQYRGDSDGRFKYYHLIDSKEFESSKSVEERNYSKDGSFFSVYKLEENEIQTTRRNTRATKRKQSSKANV